MVESFNHLRIENKDFDIERQGIKAPAATWTYLVSDNPFEEQLGFQLMGNIGLSAIASFVFRPLLLLRPLLAKFKKRI